MTFKEQFARLIDLKSLITMLVVFTLVFLTVNAMTIDPFFSTITGMVLGFYFGKSQTKEPIPNTTTTTATTISATTTDPEVR